jgi:hypothetical protein
LADSDIWSYIWGPNQYTVQKAYKAFIGHMLHTMYLATFGDQNISQSTESSSSLFFKINLTQGTDSREGTWSWIPTPMKFAYYQGLKKYIISFSDAALLQDVGHQLE